MSPKSYRETIDSLVAVMATANYSDSDCALEWQQPGDSAQHNALYSYANAALRDIADNAFVEFLAETGEVDMDLAVRGEAVQWALAHIDDEDLTIKVETEFGVSLAKAFTIVDIADELSGSAS